MTYKSTLSKQEAPAAYESPRLEPLPFLAMRKPGIQDVLATDHLDGGIRARALLEKFGSPLYVVSEERLRGDYRAFEEAFSRPGIETRVAYSIKTNYLPAICSVILDEGAWAEVVSGMEYDLVRSLGVPGSKIIFNGPYKTPEELTRAFADGALVNVDNFDELSLVEQMANNSDRPIRIGIRVSFRYGMWPWVKFGFSDDNGDCQLALERIARHPQLDLECLHNHSGTFLLNHDVYANSADRLIDVARRARNLGLTPTMIDMGGGFPSVNTLKPALDVPGGSTRNDGYLAPYGEIVCSRVLQARELFGGEPRLVLEPGRAVVDASVKLACTVIAKKRIAGKGDAIIVDAGNNLVPTSVYYEHGMSADSGGEQRRVPVSIFGPLCMQNDVIREQALLPPVEIGDSLVVSNVGAYCHTQSSQFIQPRPATVLLGPDGPEMIRRRESWRDVFALDRIPSRLRGNDVES